MPSRAKFFGGARHVVLGSGVTAYQLPPRDAGGRLYYSFDVTEPTVIVSLPYTAPSSGIAASYVRIQRDTGDFQYVVHNAGASNTLSVRRADNVAVVSISPGDAALFSLVDAAPSPVGFWLYDKRTLL